MIKVKNKLLQIIAYILVLFIMCNICFISASKYMFKARAEEVTYPKMLFMGYSGDMNAQKLHDETRLPNISDDAPSITILVHGQSGAAFHFSNDGNNNFVYEQNSMMDLLCKELNNNVNLYWAKFQDYISRRFYLFDLKDSINYKNDAEKNFLPSLTRISDISKHTIIIFESENNRNYHREVYEDLHTLIDKISYDYLVLTGKIPKINLISHSRGGITGMMYATGYIENGKIDKVKYVRNSNDELVEDTNVLYDANNKNIIHDHPFNVAGLYSLGTPYNGTAWANKITKFILEDSFDCESAMNILDNDIQNEIEYCWDEAINVNSELSLYAIAGEYDCNFIIGMFFDARDYISQQLSNFGAVETVREIVLDLIGLLEEFNQNINNFISKIENEIDGAAEKIKKKCYFASVIYSFIVSAPFKAVLEIARTKINIATTLIADIIEDIANYAIEFTVDELIYLLVSPMETIADVFSAIDDLMIYFDIEDDEVRDITLLDYDNSMENIYSIFGPSGDMFIHRSSQLAKGFDNVIRARKIFRYEFIDISVLTQELTETSENSKNFEFLKSTNHFGIPHNLETHDADMISYIISTINMSKPSVAWKYEFKTNGTATVGNCEIPEYVTDCNLRFEIPSSIDGHIITEISSRAFKECSAIENIILPSTLKSIGVEAFLMCSKLDNVIIPNGVTRINSNTFAFCLSLKNIELPIGLKQIDSCAFAATSIENIEFPSTLTRIGDAAFGLCHGLTDIVIPNSVRYFGEGVFTGCSNLEAVTLSNNITNIPDRTFYGCTSLNTVTLHEGITEIGNQAFEGCSALTNIAFPYSLEMIGEGAFRNCIGFETIVINLGADTAIEKEAFENCTSLVEVDFPLYGIEYIGEGAFKGCTSLTTINLPYSVTNIENYLFYGCTSLTNILVHNEITSIGSYAFARTGLTKIIILDNIASIGENAFYESELAQISVSNGNLHFSSKDGVLYDKDKTNLIYVPNEILGDVIIPSSITSIANESFKDRIGLTSVTIPSSVLSIGNNAFANCSNLTIYVENNTEALSGWEMMWNSSNRPVFWGCLLSATDDYIISFEKTNSSIINATALGGISAPYREGYQFNGWALEENGAVTYTATNIVNAVNDTVLYAVWTDLAISSFKFNLINSGTAYEVAVKDGITLEGEITIPAQYNGLPVTRIASYGFRDGASVNAYADTSGITMINIPSSVIVIDDYSFADCMNLKNIIFAENSNLTYIGEGAFNACVKLETITIPQSVTSIGKLAFHSCSKLRNVMFADNSQLTTLSNNVFDTCRALISIELPDSILSMGTYIFENCEDLSYVKLPANILEIPEGTFSYCGLTSIDIPYGVTTIKKNAFWGCKLKSIEISANITEIGETVFAYCGLDNITVASGNIYYKSDNNCLIKKSDNRLLCGSNKSTIPDYVEIISKYAFSHCENLEYVRIPSSVMYIEEHAFYQCNNLRNVVFRRSNNNIIVFGSSVFVDCESLESIVISNEMQIESLGNTFSLADKVTLYVETSDVTGWNGHNIPIMFGTSLSYNSEYVISFTKTDNSLLNYTEDNEIFAPYRDFYVFDGWYTNQSYTGVRYDEHEIASAENNTTYYIKWTQPECVINYQDIGGVTFSGIQPNDYPLMHTYGTTTVLSEATKVGYDFLGWYLNNDGSSDAITTLAATGYTEDISLYAKWEPKSYTITYKDVGNVAFTGVHDEWYSEMHTYGMQTMLDEPTKDQYIFEGWYLASDGSGEAITELSDTGYVEDITLYAKWSISPVTYTLLSEETGYEVSARDTNIEGEIYILNAYNGLPVVGIAENGFRNCKNITGIVIPNNIEYIGYGAFEYCDALTSITIESGSSLTEIDDWAFYSCDNLTSIVLPNCLERIGRYAFGSTGLTSIEVPQRVTEIDDSAFYWCRSLENVTIQSNSELIRIGSSAFSNCALTSVNFGQNSALEEIGSSAFRSCNLTSIMLPSGLTTIGSYAFYGNGITSIDLPASVSSISGSSFANNNITIITVNSNNETYSSNGNCLIRNSDNVLILGCNTSIIPNTVESIGDYAFNGCSSITGITLPSSVTSIGAYAFADCTNLASIEIPGSVVSIGTNAFAECTNLATITLNEGLINIGNYAFWYCSSLSSITIPSSVTSIGLYVLDNCSSLTSINVNASNAVYSSEAGVLFNKAGTILIKYPTGKAGAYTVPSGVIEIGENAFSNCAGITSVNIPSGVERINNNAFENCTTLTSITFAEGSWLSYIGDYAFWNCNAMECTTSGNNTLLSNIGSCAFESCSGITSMTIPASITYIGSYAFSGWIETQTITFLADISAVEDFDVDFLSYCYAIIEWEGYWELETQGLEYTCVVYNEEEGYEVSIGTATSGIIMIPSMYNESPVIGIAEEGFKNRTEVAKVIIIGTNLKYIGESAFEGCENLMEINVPYSVEEIGSYAFSGCTNLTHINLPMEMDTLNVGVFAFSGIKSITMPSGVVTVNMGTLDGAYEYTIYAEKSYTQATWKGRFMTVDCVIFFETEIEYDNGAYVKSILIHVRNRMQAIPTEPYRSGYIFMGWTTTEGSDVVEYTMYDLTSVNITNGTRLYAVWQEIE